MSYKLLKIGYTTLGILTLTLSLFGIIFIDTISEIVSTNTLIIISTCLCFPMFILKILHERKYPPTKKDKIIGAIIVMTTLIFIFTV